MVKFYRTIHQKKITFIFKVLESKKIFIIHFFVYIDFLCLALDCLIINNMEGFSYETFLLKSAVEIGCEVYLLNSNFILFL